MVKTHLCKAGEIATFSTPGGSVNVAQMDDDLDNTAWYLRSSSYVTEEDVRMGEGKRVGELLHEVSILISYCPFCGIELT